MRRALCVRIFAYIQNIQIMIYSNYRVQEMIFFIFFGMEGELDVKKSSAIGVVR